MMLETINIVTEKIVFSTAIFSLIILVFLTAINKKEFKNLFRKISKKTWIFLAIIFLLTLGIRITLFTPMHTVYMDEHLYMESAKNIIKNQDTDMARSVGWPVLLTIPFLIGGINNHLAIYLSFLLGILCIPLIFFITYLVFRNKNTALLASFIFSLITPNIRTSFTAQSNTASVFFVMLSVFFSLLYFERKRHDLLWLSAASWAFTAMIRIENHIFIVLFLIGMFMFLQKNIINKKNILPFVQFTLVIPNLVKSLLFQTRYISQNAYQGYGYSHWKHYLLSNSILYGKHIFGSHFYPLIVPIMFLVGVVISLKKRDKKAIFIIIWFILIWIVLFSAGFSLFGGNLELGSKTRFYMLFFPPLTIISAKGIESTISFISEKSGHMMKLKKSMIQKCLYILAYITLFFLFLPGILTISPDPLLRLHTDMPEQLEKEVPEECLVILSRPSLLTATTELRTISTKKYLDREGDFKDENCLLFLDDMFCEEWIEKAKCCHVYKRYCDEIISTKNLDIYKVYSLKGKSIIVYEIIK